MTNSSQTSGAVGTDQITRLLRQRELLRIGAVLILLLLGLPALLIGPFILSSIYWVVGLMWGFYVPWTWVFSGSFATLVPLLFWTEWRSGGSFYTDAVRDSFSDSRGSQVFMIDFSDVIGKIGAVNHPRVPVIGLTEIFLWGPRQILEAIRSIGRMRFFRKVDRNRSAQLLMKLITCDSAELAKLLPSRETDAAMMVGYLVWFEWIGASKEKGKVWLESHSRRVLEKQNTN